jgi:alkanesulfonate monooxygenase SsuD/methylene tetrahydromethanopterin reductase-like flavin-dependent oxidoreductase (luciferase family)
MQFGIFDHMDRGGVPLGEQYENRLRLIEAYERAGIRSYHVAEHHSTPLGMAPAPSVFLAAIAQRTRTLRFGPLVYQLPLHHPLRLMEEICMLDHLSGGRLELGVGRGAVSYEIEYYGVDPKEAQARYMEAYQVLLKALAGGILTFEGKFYSYRDVPLEIEPVQKPHPPLWYGVINGEGAAWAARNCINIVCNAPTPVARPIFERYRAEWRDAGKDMTDIPFLSMNRFLVLTDSDEEAMAIGRRAYKVWSDNFWKLWNLRGGKPNNLAAVYPGTFDELQHMGFAAAGTPAKVRDTLIPQLAEAGNNYLLCRFAFGDLTLPESLHSLDLFAREVMPALLELRTAAE